MNQSLQLRALRFMRIPSYASLLALLLAMGGANADDAARNENPKPLVANRNAAITPGTLQPKFLLALEAMLPEKKVSEAALEKAMGIRMRPHPNWQGQTYYQGIVEDGRKYTFIYGPIAGRDRIWLILVEDNPPNDSAKCLLRFDRFHRKLIDMGFKGARRNTEHEHAPRNGWLYARTGIEVTVDYDPRRNIRRGEDLDAKNLCIENIKISAEEG